MTSSSPIPAGFSSAQEELLYYKKQYEHLESELQDFQASSKELEQELEKDIEASEARERTLREKVEKLGYEVDEWQTKCKQAKAEASNAQNSLQKEITQLRDTNRTQQLRLRDIEVANDDYERQARNTTMSLEDMESKYNQIIERDVMLEEEIKSGEQERENLRIEAQRLKDELSDLRIESDITQEKLKAAEAANERNMKRISYFSNTKQSGIQSPASEGSVTSVSLASALTPDRPISNSSAGNGSEAVTPPSPPLSERSGSKHDAETAQSTQQPGRKTPVLPRDPHLTPKPTANATATRAIHTREKSRTGPPRPTPVFARPRITASKASRPSMLGAEGGVPRSESLYHIRGLIGKMQKLEQRVHSAKSKLPAPTNTPPRASPRGGSITPSALSNEVPSNVTVRSSRKRASGSTSASGTFSQAQTDGSVKRLTNRQSRISLSRPVSSMADRVDRPDSRASNASQGVFARPSSRMETYGRPPSAAEERRPRSSLAGRATPSYGHRPSLSLARDGEREEDSFVTPAARRTTLDKGFTGIPTPATLARRQSNQALAKSATPARRQSIKQGVGTAQRGIARLNVGRKSTDLGETF